MEIPLSKGVHFRQDGPAHRPKKADIDLIEVCSAFSVIENFWAILDGGISERATPTVSRLDGRAEWTTAARYQCFNQVHTREFTSLREA
jgi:hypothetical protein